MTETADYMRKFWIWVNFWLKKKAERDYCYERSNMKTYERMKTIQLLIFFQPKIKTYPEITHDSTETMTVQNRSVTGHVIRYTFTLNVISEMLNMRTCHWLSRWWYCRQRRPVAARNRKKIQKRRDRAKVCYLGIRHMYDDIAYSKDDIQKT